MPGAAVEWTSAMICLLTSAVQVGWPCWSSTTSTVGRWSSSLIIVRTKFGPCAPYSHAVLTT
jgi:hypothetical protein